MGIELLGEAISRHVLEMGGDHNEKESEHEEKDVKQSWYRLFLLVLVVRVF